MPTGFVTDAYLMLTMRNYWTSYYKWLQQGKWSWLALARQFAQLVLANMTHDVVHLAIDDTVTLRASKKAPGSRIHHQHGNKINLPAFVQGQWLGQSGNHHSSGQQRAGSVAVTFPLDAS